jgi:alpha-1,2-mannosyltransferase
MSLPSSLSWKQYWFIPLYILLRVHLANRMPVTDCDEVYNYWEPLHFILYGNGQQTWEYAHDYALRTFAYLVPVKYVATFIQAGLERMSNGNSNSSSFSLWVVELLAGIVIVDSDMTINNSKLVVFLCLRAGQAALTAAAEVYWLLTLQDTLKLSHQVTATLATVLLTSSGMTHAAAAYLPSATWMGVWMMCATTMMQRKSTAFVVTAVTGTLATGWPFGAVCVAPMGVRILWNEYEAGRLFRFVCGTVVPLTVVIQAVVMRVDVQYYGRWVSPTWNIFSYNAGSSGDELYGVEPVSFYVKNLFLNLNFVAVLGLVALPVKLLSNRQQDWNIITMLSCMYVWLAITVPRPHKEERFLFPIYPVLCLGAVLTVDSALNAIGRIEASVSRHKELVKRQRVGLTILLWLPVVLLSCCRSAALMKYYTAPLTVYTALAFVQHQPQQEQKQRLACTCGEWYRFPGSFYLPPNVELGFLPAAGFTGQLPQAFSEYGSLAQGREVLQPFNDENRQEMERYVDIKDCTWVIDLEGGECTPANSRTLASAPFLDAERTSTLHRILYLPYFHERAIENGQVHYQNYVLSELN